MLIWPHQTPRSPYMELACSDITMMFWHHNDDSTSSTEWLTRILWIFQIQPTLLKISNSPFKNSSQHRTSDTWLLNCAVLKSSVVSARPHPLGRGRFSLGRGRFSPLLATRASYWCNYNHANVMEYENMVLQSLSHDTGHHLCLM